jgi:hypothetical protein
LVFITCLWRTFRRKRKKRKERKEREEEEERGRREEGGGGGPAIQIQWIGKMQLDLTQLRS